MKIEEPSKGKHLLVSIYALGLKGYHRVRGDLRLGTEVLHVVCWSKASPVLKEGTAGGRVYESLKVLRLKCQSNV